MHSKVFDHQLKLLDLRGCIQLSKTYVQEMIKTDTKIILDKKTCKAYFEDMLN